MSNSKFYIDISARKSCTMESSSVEGNLDDGLRISYEHISDADQLQPTSLKRNLKRRKNDQNGESLESTKVSKFDEIRPTDIPPWRRCQPLPKPVKSASAVNLDLNLDTQLFAAVKKVINPFASFSDDDQSSDEESPSMWLSLGSIGESAAGPAASMSEREIENKELEIEKNVEPPQKVVDPKVPKVIPPRVVPPRLLEQQVSANEHVEPELSTAALVWWHDLWAAECGTGSGVWIEVPTPEPPKRRLTPTPPSYPPPAHLLVKRDLDHQVQDGNCLAHGNI